MSNTAPITIKKALALITSLLASKDGYELIELQSKQLVSAITKIPIEYLEQHSSQMLNEQQHKSVMKYLNSGAEFPVPLYLGFTEVNGKKLKVSKSVLLPGTETTPLINLMSELIKGIHKPIIVELGTGSGVIPILLASMKKDAQFIVTEISVRALKVAAYNIKFHQLNERIKILHGNWFNPLSNIKKKSIDFLVSNPPYVSTDAIKYLPNHFVKNAPLKAINGGHDGLNSHRIIIKHSPAFLKSGGCLVLQTESGQADQVKDLIVQSGLYQIPKSINGSANIPRIVFAKTL